MSNFIRNTLENPRALLAAGAIGLTAVSGCANGNQVEGTQGRVVDATYLDQPIPLVGYEFKSSRTGGVGTADMVMVCDMRADTDEFTQEAVGLQGTVTVREGDTIIGLVAKNRPDLISSYVTDPTPSDTTIANFIAEYNGVDPNALPVGTVLAWPSACDTPVKGVQVTEKEELLLDDDTN